MALGKPIITTNVAGCDELVRESSNGFLCKVQNKYDLAEKMFSILNLKKEEVMKMGEKGKQIIQTEYSNEIVANKYLHQYTNQNKFIYLILNQIHSYILN